MARTSEGIEEIMEYEWGTDYTDNLKLYNAEMDFKEAVESFEKVKCELYWATYWLCYALAHRN